MENLRKELESILNINTDKSSRKFQSNEERSIIYRLVDMELIRYKGSATGDIVEGDEIWKAIDSCIQGYLWLYEKGLASSSSIKQELTSREDVEKYKTIEEAFILYSDFMTTHIHLV
jgi:hypothetical protein